MREVSVLPDNDVNGQTPLTESRPEEPTDEAGGGGSPQSAPTSPPTKAASARTTRAARKPAKKRVAGKKAAARKSRAQQTAPPQTKFPRHAVLKALRIPKALYDQGASKGASLAEAARYTTGGSANGAFNVEVASSKKYGFLNSESGKLVPTERSRMALYPQSDTDRLTALREAVLAAPDLGAVYSRYRGENLPDKEFFTNALRDTFKIPADKISEFLDVFDESMRSAELIDDSSERPRLVDLGRDETLAAQAPSGGKKVVIAAGTTCFVMQPFAAPLGEYYELIFRPAIIQASLTAIRADDDMFATGQIMDQVRRGIAQATILVAELTSRNPNVLYELGLAHALEKPVILVSSNQEDVPFDLRHIRVILYDRDDPFWGQKLIDKIAENIRSALANPDEAIFRMSEG